MTRGSPHKCFGSDRRLSSCVRPQRSQKKTPAAYATRVLLIKSLTMTYSHMGSPTLPSAIRRFTSEFGKGSGGSTALLSSSKALHTLVCMRIHWICIKWVLRTNLALTTSSNLYKAFTVKALSFASIHACFFHTRSSQLLYDFTKPFRVIWSSLTGN